LYFSGKQLNIIKIFSSHKKMENSENPFNIDPKQQKKYEAKKRAEEIKELEAKYEEDLASYTETEEEVEYEESQEENIAIQEIIEKIKKKDPEIYDGNKKIFEEIKQAHKKETTEKPADKQKESSYRLKDYYREKTLDIMNKTPEETTEELFPIKEEDSCSEDASEEKQVRDRKQERIKRKTEYNEEQKENIKAFISAMEEINTTDELFQKKTEEEVKEEDPENFLTEYVLKGGWQKENETNKEEELLFLEEDSEELELIEEFDKETIPTTQGKFATVKKPVQKRKRKELKKKLRNREEEKIKQEEIKRLKNLKKQQFMDRISILRSVSGLSKRQLSKIKLDEVYDRKEFDKTLESLFGEEYFNKEEEERPKIKGYETEAQELKQLEELAENAELQQDRTSISEIKKILSEIREIGKEYATLKKQGDFEYVEMPAVNIGLSTKEILLADDKFLKMHYSIKNY
ncbi:hypothetical protein NEIRO02_2671, partial [Nematocida sp. AWRm79]